MASSRWPGRRMAAMYPTPCCWLTMGFCLARLHKKVDHVHPRRQRKMAYRFHPPMVSHSSSPCFERLAPSGGHTALQAQDLDRVPGWPRPRSRLDSHLESRTESRCAHARHLSEAGASLASVLFDDAERGKCSTLLLVGMRRRALARRSAFSFVDIYHKISGALLTNCRASQMSLRR